MALPRITDDERRRRIAVRHALAPAHRLDSVTGVTGTMTVLHATEAATVHLAVAARADRVSVADVDTARAVQAMGRVRLQVTGRPPTTSPSFDCAGAQATSGRAAAAIPRRRERRRKNSG